MSQGLRQVSRLALVGAVLLASAPLALAASVPPEADALTEFSAELWTAGADGASASVADDTVTIRRGKASLRFDTDGGFDTWLATPPKKDAGWDFTAPGVDGVGFWVRAQNANPTGFQNSSPWIRLHTTAEDYVELHSVGEQLNPARFNWVFLFAPLEGAWNWTRTEVGSPDLSEVNWIEIHADTWDFGFTLWMDGLQFRKPQPISLDVTPPSIAVPLGIASRFSAELIYDNGQTPSATFFSVWSGDPPSSATVLGPGRFFGTTEGAVAISAALGFGIDLVGTAMLEVLPPPAVAPFELVGVASDGSIGNAGVVDFPDLSADGRFVAFTSAASNLVLGDVNGHADVFVRDRLTGTTELISVGSDGSPANGPSELGPQISGDGRFVVFRSRATNLVEGPTREFGEIYVRDRQKGTTELIDFADGVSNVVYYFPDNCGISADGAFLCATVTMWDESIVYVAPTAWRYDRANGVAEVVSADALGTPSLVPAVIFYSSISSDGRYVGFESTDVLAPLATPGFLNAYRKDMVTGEVSLLSIGVDGVPADGGSSFVQLDASGTVSVFRSAATNLIDPPATNTLFDIYVRKLPDGPTTRVSTALGGGESNGLAASLSISGNGRFVAFRSSGTDLFEGDTNGVSDMFRVDLLTGARDVVTLAPWGLADGPSIFGSSLNHDGSVLLFPTDAGNLALGDTNLAIDALIREYPPVDPADLDGDGIVGGADLAILLGAWGSNDPAADLDGDGVVGASDLAILLGGWKG